MTRSIARMYAAMALAACAMVAFACGGSGSSTATQTATVASTAPAATPPCDAAQRLTPSRDEGQHFKPGSPERASLIEIGATGASLTIAGAVLSASCRPVSGVVLDFWQADDAGAYRSDDRLRGHQTTDANGRYRLETIVPGIEPGRARHISVTVSPPDGAPLTTELYFAGDASNAGDDAFDASLAMDVQVEGGRKVAGFDFVLP